MIEECWTGLIAVVEALGWVEEVSYCVVVAVVECVDLEGRHVESDLRYSLLMFDVVFRL